MEGPLSLAVELELQRGRSELELARMMGANTNDAYCLCPEYAEVDPTGRYGRVRNRHRCCSSSHHRFSIRFLCSPNR